MRTGTPWMMIGVSMFILGIILFYSINPEDNENLENVRNTGTFVGLTGIGVAVAGILLFLISRNPQPINENYDMK